MKKKSSGYESVVAVSEPPSQNGEETKVIDPAQVIPIPGLILTQEAYELIAQPLPQQNKQTAVNC